jgi:poly-beta-1,6-N-acetyl-D-glucosamine synthase
MNLIILACLIFIVSSYAGYPLWLWWRARVAAQPWQHAESATPVSVVIAVHNEAQRLPGRLENLAAMVPAPAQIVVVLDGCKDDSLACLSRLQQDWRALPAAPELLVIEQKPQAGKAAALNLAMAAVSAPLVLFADARQTFASDVLGVLRQNFADPAVGAVSGELCFSAGDQGDAAAAGLYWRLEKSIRRHQALTGSVMGATGAIYMIRRELYQPLRPGELVDDLATPLAVIAAGYRVVFDSRALAWDEPPSDTVREWHRKVRTLTGVWLLLPLLANLLMRREAGAVLRFLAHKLSRLLVPWALLLMLLASLMASGFWFGFALLQLAGYLFAGLMYWLPALRRLPLVGTGYFFVLLNLAAAKAGILAVAGAGHQVWKTAGSVVLADQERRS